MYGFISRGNSQVSFYIRVEGYPERGFFDYTFREALKAYRQQYGLVGKHINFFDWR